MPYPQSTVTIPPELAIMIRRRFQREREREFVVEFCEKSDRLRQKFAPVWREVLENYLVVPMGGGGYNTAGAFPRSELGPRIPSGGRGGALLKDPESHQIAETLASQGLILALGAKDYLRAIPLGEDDPVKAKQISRLLMGVFSQRGAWLTMYQLLKDSFIFGTSIAEIGWEKRTRAQMVKRGGFVVPGEVVYRDQPLIRPVDIYDFYPDPSGTRIHSDMMGVAKRFRMTDVQARDQVRAGVWSGPATERAIAHQGRDGKDDRGRTEKRFSALSSETATQFGMMTGYEYWGRVPFTPEDGATNRVITILEGEVVRSHINPFIDGEIPFKEITINPIQGRFYGLGPLEVIRYLQDAADNMLMVLNDSADRAVRPTLLMGLAFGGDPNRLRRREFGDVIDCANVDAVKELPTDLNALQFAGADLLRRKIAMREASGAADIIQAIEGGERKTATEVSTLTRFATQRIQATMMTTEREDLPWFGTTTHSRLRQFAGDELLTTLNGEAMLIPFGDIDVDADVEFVGARQAQSKFQEVISLREALMMLNQNPESAEQYPELTERYLDALEVPDSGKQVANAAKFSQQKRMLSILLQQEQERRQASQRTGGASSNVTEAFGSDAGQTEIGGQAIA